MCEQIPVGELGDADLNREITATARTEAAAAGRRLAAVAELAARRLGSEVARFREYWAADATDSVAAEVACDLVITHRRAVAMIYQALDLRLRIPQTGDLLRRGEISEKVATTASWRTRLIEDPELLARVDADIAQVATRWGGYGTQRLHDAIDARVERHDPDAVRTFRMWQRAMTVGFGKRDDETGTRSVYGRLSTVDAEIADRAITALINAVCPNDPRTVGQRRSEAFGVIMAGGTHLPCRCERADCPAPTGPDARGRLFEILVLTDDPDAGTGAVEQPPAPDPDPDVPVDPRIEDPDYDMSQHWYDDPPDDEDVPPEEEDVPPEEEPYEPAATTEPIEPVEPVTLAECASPTTESTPTPAPCRYTTIIAGGAVVPAALLADLRRMGASVRTVVKPEELQAEPGYRPSVALQRMVRARDMTCRFTGCDRPAEYCDTDHTIPYADSRLTHPGNTKMLCRKHHLLKTFWVGRGGWTDTQLADGTIVWTSPSGIEHRAPPGSRIFFPDWDTTTPLPDGPPVVLTEPSPHRGLRMPTRRRTRAQQRTASIRAERRRNRKTRDTTPAPF
jgi:hypothetical protein